MDKIHVTVAAIIKRNQHYLLVKEKASSGDIVFNQPAGHVELYESLSDAIIREVKEETNLDFKPDSVIGTYLLSPASNGKTYLRFCFYGQVPEQQIASPNDPDIIDNHWFSLNQISQLSRKELRSALVIQCIQDFESGKCLPLDSLKFYADEHQLADQCHSK
ncbi:MAG: NUDIX hydrolase [Enterobacterales bacterium]|nr:NUDIX hydrolase [Enterobacterales bacterium]